MIMAIDIRKFLLSRETPTFNAYYNGKMSYRLHGKAWPSTWMRHSRT